MEVFNLGQKVRVSAEFTDADGAQADPTAIFAVVKAPDVAAVTYEYNVDAELVKDDTGDYHLDLSLSSAGVWAVRWYSTGTIQAGSSDTLINVRETATD